MQNAVITLFPRAKVKYKFINRGKTQFPKGFADRLKNQINKLTNLFLTNSEKKYLEEVCYYLPPTYIDFLKGFKYNPDEVQLKQSGGELFVEIKGYWYRTILWEVPLLAIISELYFKMKKTQKYSEEKIKETAKEKANFFKDINIKYADFGTRRRFSEYNHDIILKTLKKYSPDNLVGTSNVFFAKKNNIKPIGTHAHEWFMFHAAKFGFKMANKLALENWVKIYRGDLGIALSDTFTTEAFFKSFDTKLAKLFDGVRQDSGNPFVFGDKTIEHYKKLKIDPKSKTIIFSDALKPEKVEKIAKYFKNKIKFSFGIGTNLTNDVGVKPLNIVIKILEGMPEGRSWIPTIKLSDSKGKYTGDSDMIDISKKILDI